MSKFRLYLISLYILIFWILGVIDLITRILINLNLPIIPFSKLFFGIIPAFYIIQYRGVKSSDLKFIVLTVLLILWITYFERIILNETGNIFLIEQLFFIGLYFITIKKIHIGGKTKNAIENLIIFSGLFYAVLSYLIYFGILHLSGTSEFQLGIERARLNLVNINHVSYLSALAIAISFNKLNRREMSRAVFFMILIFEISIIIINSSRGALLFVLLVLLINLINFKKFQLKVILIFLVLLLIVSFINIKQLDIFYRMTSELEDINSLGRTEQIMANWENIYSNPILGVGYSKAAKTTWANYAWSNNSFTQILAAYGVIFWLLLILGFFRKMFWPGIRYLNRELLTLFAFVIIFYFFNRLFLYPVILAYFLSNSIMIKRINNDKVLNK